jgi:hypothetical protein
MLLDLLEAAIRNADLVHALRLVGELRRGPDHETAKHEPLAVSLAATKGSWRVGPRGKLRPDNAGTCQSSTEIGNRFSAA